MDWARILAYITGTVDQELLSRNEYLVTENRILKRQLKGRFLLSDAERARLGEIGHRLGRKALADVANAAKPDTILGWYRRLVAGKFDGSKQRRYPGRPRVERELDELVVSSLPGRYSIKTASWRCAGLRRQRQVRFGLPPIWQSKRSSNQPSRGTLWFSYALPRKALG
jgi:hypothetical protein